VFVSNKNPLDIYVANPREVWFSGQGGYIYKSTNIANGVSVVNAGAVTTENLNRITGNGDILVCAGDNGKIIKSINRGATWATTTTVPGAATDDFKAVAVLDKYTYWVGSNVGEIYYTLNGGDSWTEYEFAGSGAGTVDDIVFYGSEVGFFTHATATPVGSIYATWNGGANWTKSSPRINGLPVLDKINRIAIPQVHISLAVNTIAAGGLADDGARNGQARGLDLGRGEILVDRGLQRPGRIHHHDAGRLQSAQNVHAKHHLLQRARRHGSHQHAIDRA